MKKFGFFVIITIYIFTVSLFWDASVVLAANATGTCTYKNTALNEEFTLTIYSVSEAGASAKFSDGKTATTEGFADAVIVDKCPSAVYYNSSKDSNYATIIFYTESLAKTILDGEKIYKADFVSGDLTPPYPSLTCQYGPVTVVVNRWNAPTSSGGWEFKKSAFSVNLKGPYMANNAVLIDFNKEFTSTTGDECPGKVYTTCNSQRQDCKVSLNSGTETWNLNDPLPAVCNQDRLVCNYGAWKYTVSADGKETLQKTDGTFKKESTSHDGAWVAYGWLLTPYDDRQALSTCPDKLYVGTVTETKSGNPEYNVSLANYSGAGTWECINLNGTSCTSEAEKPKLYCEYLSEEGKTYYYRDFGNGTYNQNFSWNPDSSVDFFIDWHEEMKKENPSCPDVSFSCEGTVCTTSSLLGFCNPGSDVSLLSGLRIAGILLYIVKILVPLLIIIIGIMDFTKALISSNDDEIKKSTFSLLKRLIAGFIIFFIPTVIKIIFNLVPNYDETSFINCTNCVLDIKNCSVHNVPND